MRPGCGDRAHSGGRVLNATDKQGRTALWHAADRGNSGTVEILIGKGADLHLADADGLTPFLRAIETRNEETALLLLRKGSENQRATSSGNTPLILAAYHGLVMLCGRCCRAGSISTSKTAMVTTRL